MISSSVAPCGINCKLCSAFRRERNKCPGCLSDDPNPDLKHLSTCKIKFCKEKGDVATLCYECKKFPCVLIKHLDKRYSTKHHLSVIENLNFIKEHGRIEFEKWQNEKWLCPKCKKDLICCHKKTCFGCGFEKTEWSENEDVNKSLIKNKQ